MAHSEGERRGDPGKSLPFAWLKPMVCVIAIVIGIPAWAAVCFGLWWLLVSLSHSPHP